MEEKCLFDFYVKREYSEKLPVTLVKNVHTYSHVNYYKTTVNRNYCFT